MMHKSFLSDRLCLAALLFGFVLGLVLTGCNEQEQGPASQGGAHKDILSTGAVKFINQEKPLILDVRTPREYQAARLSGARLVPYKKVGDHLDELAGYKNKPILLYCTSGVRSAVAARELAKNGFTRVYNMQDGLMGWARNNYPILTR